MRTAGTVRSRTLFPRAIPRRAETISASRWAGANSASPALRRSAAPSRLTRRGTPGLSVVGGGPRGTGRRPDRPCTRSPAPTPATTAAAATTPTTARMDERGCSISDTSPERRTPWPEPTAAHHRRLTRSSVACRPRCLGSARSRRRPETPCAVGRCGSIAIAAHHISSHVAGPVGAGETGDEPSGAGVASSSTDASSGVAVPRSALANSRTSRRT